MLSLLKSIETEIDEDLSIDGILNDFQPQNEQIVLTVRLPKDVVSKIDEIAQNSHISRSKLLENALYKYLRD